jgi:hypothetical protein
MGELAYKIRLTGLWLMHMVAFFAYRTIALSEEHSEVTVTSNRELANILGICMVLGFLTLILNRRANRLMNIIGGSIFTVAGAALFVDGLTAYPTSSMSFMTGAMLVMAVFIIIFAARWPKQQQE